MERGFTELTAPASTLGKAKGKPARAMLFASVSALLLCAAVIALTTQDGSSMETSDTVLITQADLVASAAAEAARVGSLATQKAGNLRGSIPTAEAEANSIIDTSQDGENAGKNWQATMGDPFKSVTGSHSDDAKEADEIINQVEKVNMDLTGAAGAALYQSAADTPKSAWMRGSIPNYRSESNYILSGIYGNYEKSLENAPTMAVVGGKVSPRIVASAIVDEAYKDATSPDCTGSVDKDGVHGVGKGTPPCIAMTAFNGAAAAHQSSSA